MWCVRGGARGAGGAALVLAAAALLAAAEMEGANALAQPAPAPFLVGSRYGRSSPRLIAPRNDKFFMGSRYGKRADADLGPPPPPPPAAGGRGGEGVGAREGGAALDCAYTGVYALYRCRPAAAGARTHVQPDRSMPEEWSSEED